jgi:hypothetical protein
MVIPRITFRLIRMPNRIRIGDGAVGPSTAVGTAADGDSATGMDTAGMVTAGMVTAARTVAEAGTDMGVRMVAEADTGVRMVAEVRTVMGAAMGTAAAVTDAEAEAGGAKIDRVNI